MYGALGFSYAYGYHYRVAGHYPASAP